MPGRLGLNYGETRSEVIAAVGASHVKPGHIKEALILDTAPKPHPNFESYGSDLLANQRADQDHCSWQRTSTRTQLAIRARTSFTAWMQPLTVIYGPPVTVDSLAPGSIWKDEGDWTMAVIKKVSGNCSVCGTRTSQRQSISRALSWR